MKKVALPLAKVYGLLEPGPVVLLESAEVLAAPVEAADALPRHVAHEARSERLAR